MESHHTSSHYVQRRGYKRFLCRRWPKITAICDTETYYLAACIVTQGPSNDSPQLGPAIVQAHQYIHFDRLLADAGFDGEHHHIFCRQRLGIRSTIIALNKRRGRKWPKTKYRRQMKTRFPHRLYRQRWHIESVFSQHKCVLGSALRARTVATRKRECYLRVLTHNLMIFRHAA